MPDIPAFDEASAIEKKPKRPDVPRYFRIACHFWEDEKVLTWPKTMRLFAIYLLTTKHRTLEGFFVLSPMYMAADIGFSIRQVKEMLKKLEEDGFLRFDEKVNLVLLRNALRYQQPDSLNVQKAVISRVRNLPNNSEFLKEFIRLARFHCLRKELSPFAQGLPALLEKEFVNASTSTQNIKAI